MPWHKKSRNAASNLTTGLHHEPHPIKCLNVDTCKIFGSSCPRCLVDDPYLDVPCRSKPGCGPTNDQGVDSPHNVLFYNAFPDHVLNPCIPVMQNLCQGRDQSVTSSWWADHAPKQFTECHVNLVDFFQDRPMACSKTCRWSDNCIKISASCCQ